MYRLAALPPRLLKRLVGLLVVVIGLATPTSMWAEVLRIVIDERVDVLEGRAFGGVGVYEKIVGRVFFVFDPANPMNARIVDLDKAPRNADGLVEVWANFVVLQPKDPSRSARTALLEVSNRGGKASLSYFNGARGSRNPELEEHFGDGLLMRHGLTVIWVGWQHDVPDQEHILKSHLPVATEGADAIRGLVRSDWTVDRATNTLGLGHRTQIAYPVADTGHADNVLTVRDGRMAPRRVIPKLDWSFARLENDRVVFDSTSIHMERGFEAGKIYEMVYVAEEPTVVGLGLAIIRDMMSYAKYGEDRLFPVDRGIAIGISQTGRFLRHFVYQGFNTDERNRKVFDGLMVHTAGAGRGSFNHRFAQPSRDAHPYSAFFYPTDIFPFTSRTQTDPETGDIDGLFAHQHNDAHLPRIFYTNTGYEYWGRAASLIHTTVDGRDIELYPNERVYHLASGQHGVGRFPPPDNSRLPNTNAYRGNPLHFQYTIRSLLVQMMDWAWDVSSPPPSMYPKVAAGTLVPVEQVEFPELAGLAFPKVAHDAYRAYYGSRWQQGIIDIQPPQLGKRFPVMVPQVDRIGNERGGVPTVEILAPLATYAPWNLRTGFSGGTDALTNFTGTYIPLAKTEEERRSSGDPRPSIEALYRDKDDYLRAAEEAARSLAERGLLLDEHVDAVVARAEAHWDWVMSRE